MKIAFIIMTAVAFAGSLLARDLEIFGNFTRLDKDKKAPFYWLKNSANHPDIGNVKFVPATENEKGAVQVVTTKKTTFFYSGSMHPVKPGETVKIKADIKGKGTAGVGIYVYGKVNGKGHWLFEKMLASEIAENEFKEVKGEYIVKDNYPATIEDVKTQLAPDHIRVVFFAGQFSDVIFRSVEAEIEAVK